MDELRTFKVIRNRLVHNLLSLTPEEIGKIDNDFDQIKLLSEGLLNRYDNIIKGITIVWDTYLKKLNARNVVTANNNQDKV